MATTAILAAQLGSVEERAHLLGTTLVADQYLFTDAGDGSEPWRPGTITQYFGRLRARIRLEHLDFHYLRKFMETYGQDAGFSPSAVAIRAGHDPSVAAKHYISRIAAVDRELAEAVAALITASGAENPRARATRAP